MSFDPRMSAYKHREIALGSFIGLCCVCVVLGRVVGSDLLTAIGYLPLALLVVLAVGVVIVLAIDGVTRALTGIGIAERLLRK